MGWKDLLQTDNETVTLPWVGGRTLRSKDRVWSLSGPNPPEHGWHQFSIQGRKATWVKSSDPVLEALKWVAKGYLVGDLIIPDGVTVDPDPRKVHQVAERVYLLEPGLDRFTRIVAGRVFEGGPLVYSQMDMPMGPEPEVLDAYLNKAPNLTLIKGVTPALDVAFRVETQHRAETERRRAELERLRALEEEQRRVAEQRAQLVRQLGDGAGRRQMALVDFEAAAKAALAVGGARYLDHRDSYTRGEKVVRFQLSDRTFECVCDTSLRIVDSGICLTAEYDQDDFERGTKGDTWFTLESLPGVILEAQRLRRLVVFRHAD